MITVFRSKLAG